MTFLAFHSYLSHETLQGSNFFSIDREKNSLQEKSFLIYLNSFHLVWKLHKRVVQELQFSKTTLTLTCFGALFSSSINVLFDVILFQSIDPANSPQMK